MPDMILDSGNSSINKITTNSLCFNERRLVLNKQKIEKEKKKKPDDYKCYARNKNWVM